MLTTTGHCAAVRSVNARHFEPAALGGVCIRRRDGAPSGKFLR